MSDDRFPPEALDHERFDELAAGYALDSLELEDQREFAEHLEHCARCQILAADFAEVASQLASAASGATARRELRDEIVATARRTPHGARDDEVLSSTEASSLAPVTPLSPPLARHRSRVLIAVAAVLIVVGGILGGVLGSQGGLGPPPARCTANIGCTEVTLTSVQTHRAVARVIVAHGSVWLRPLRLSPDARAREIYVLWQIEGSHAPRAVGGFDVVAGRRAAVPIGALVAPRRRGTSFAISLEPGRHVPRAPTHVVAVEHLA